jgi:sedoheptulokinase
MRTVIGLDLGTTTVTGVLLDTHRQEVVHLIQRPNDSALKTAVPTRAEQDPRRLFTTVLGLLADLAARGNPSAGITVTGQMHGLICVDANGQPLTPLISWQDQRTAEPLPGGSTPLEQLHARSADLDWRANGCPIAHGYGAATYFWLVRRGRFPSATQRVCTLPDWVVGQLTGHLPATDPTLAASWGVYSLIDRDWNAAFIDRLELEPRLLPRVQPSGEQMGGLVQQVARKTGLPGGLPVFNVIGDNQASFLGSVADPVNTFLFNLGTGGQICWMAPEFEQPTEAVETRPLPGGRFLRVGASLCGGAAYAWLNRVVRNWLVDFGIDLDEKAVYERLDALAGNAKDTEGLEVRTTFMGTRGDPTVQAGAIMGITLDNLRLGALARATMVGQVDELRDLYQTHVKGATRHASAVATGGGVQKNPLLPGLIQERFGMPVQVPRQREIAAIGAARLALKQQPQ